MLKVDRENGNLLKPIQLWAKYQDVTLYLERTSCQLKRFIIFVMHLQIFLLP